MSIFLRWLEYIAIKTLCVILSMIPYPMAIYIARVIIFLPMPNWHKVIKSCLSTKICFYPVIKLLLNILWFFNFIISLSNCARYIQAWI